MNNSFDSTFKKKVTAQGKNIRAQNITQANQTYLATFKQSPSYYNVGIGSKEKRFDVQIFNLRTFETIDTIKHMQLAPYQDIKEFRAGNYVYWKDDAGFDLVWIIKSTDMRSPQKAMAEIFECNTYLQWIDTDGVKQSVKCAFRDKFSAETPRVSSVVKTFEGNSIVYVQLNELTSKITANQTFIFGGRPEEKDESGKIIKEKIAGQKYKVMAFQYETNDYEMGEQLLAIVIEKTNANPETDDLYNNWTDIFTEKKKACKKRKKEVESSELINTYTYEVLPDIAVIKKGLEQIFLIKEYFNNVENKIKFNVVDHKFYNWNNYYEISGIDGDLNDCSSFKIKNIKQYTTAPLEIKIYKNTNELIKILEIKLGGL